MTTPRRYLVYLWLASSTLAALLCLYKLSATLVNGEFIPADQDSFYHARRILDAIQNPPAMYQFDPRMHTPEGSWITWPWAYDMGMAALGHVYLALTGATDPMAFLALVAPLWVFLNMALMLGITIELSLAFPLQIVAMLFYALLPLTRSIHRVGMLDHHFVEYTFVLATIYFGLRSFARPNSRPRAIQLAAILGIAPAFHNGLFILQLPVLLTFMVLWLRDVRLPFQSIRAYSLMLLGSTSIVLLPSEPFRLGMFSFYLHSWFHLYVAFCTATATMLVGHLRFSWRNLLAVMTVLAVLAVPLVSQMEIGGSWVSGNMPELQNIIEVESPWHAIWTGRSQWIVNLYSCLFLCLPFAVLSFSIRLRKQHSFDNMFFGIFLLFGASLLSSQIRLQYFGSFALALPWCVIVNDRLHSKRSWKSVASLGAVFALSLLPGNSDLLHTRTPPGTDFQFSYSIDIFKTLRTACKHKPGIVLAEQNDGHIVRYYSDCSVISNNFIMTPQHQQKIQETRRLLGTTYEEALSQRPDIKYILIRRADPVLYTREQSCGADCPENTGLAAELLFDLKPLPTSLRLLAEAMIPVGTSRVPFVRLYEVSVDADK